MKVNELGVQLIGDYRKIIRMSWARRENLEKLAVDKKDVDKLWGAYLGIEMPRLPKGLDSQALITVEIAEPPVDKK